LVRIASRERSRFTPLDERHDAGIKRFSSPHQALHHARQGTARRGVDASMDLDGGDPGSEFWFGGAARPDSWSID